MKESTHKLSKAGTHGVLVAMIARTPRAAHVAHNLVPWFDGYSHSRGARWRCVRGGAFLMGFLHTMPSWNVLMGLLQASTVKMWAFRGWPFGVPVGAAYDALQLPVVPAGPHQN